MLASHGATLAHFISKEHLMHFGDFVPRNKSTIWYLNNKKKIYMTQANVHDAGSKASGT